MVASDPQLHDLERAATLLGCAFDQADPNEALDSVGRWLGSMAYDCPADFAALLDHVVGRNELRGATGDYYDPRNSMLHAMVESGDGMPITICLVVKLVGQRVGLEVEMIGLPGHVMVRCGQQWADPFTGPTALTVEQALRRWTHHSGQNVAALNTDHLAAMPPRQVIVRMLNNLTAEYARRNDPFALSTAVRLRQPFREFGGEQQQRAAWQAAWN